jgi:hypothetical protein
MVTVFFSIDAFGLTAAADAKWYAMRAEGVVEPERAVVNDVPEMLVQADPRSNAARLS